MSENNESENIVIDFEQIEQVSQVFFAESKEILDGLDDLILNLENNPQDSGVLNNIFRQVHTLKGSVGAVPGGQLLGSLAHEFEALLSKLKKEKATINKEGIDLFLHSSKLLKMLANSLRQQEELMPEVLSEVIEVINRYGGFELPQNESQDRVIESTQRTGRKVKIESSNLTDEGIWLTQNQLSEMLKVSGEILVLKNHFQIMTQTGDFASRQTEFSQNLNKISDLFQTQLSKILKVKAEDCFRGLNALVRQAATELNKEVVLTTVGLDLLIDKSLGRDINETLVHLIRNSIDHGVEDPFDRATDGKPSTGHLNFEISERNGYVIVDFSDDGRGLNKNKILQKAIEKKLVSEASAAQLTDEQIYAFIFHPGFSTKEKITTISGRGVGMDVVHSIVQKYHGKIKITSNPGQGSQFHMEFALPQHMMMEPAILCSWKNQQLAVPLANVMQILSVHNLAITEVDRIRYCQWNGLTVPLLDYAEICERKINNQSQNTQSAIFIKHKEFVLGFMVDTILGQTELMVRMFSSFIKAIAGFKGTSVLADDKVTYVVDVEKMIDILKINSEHTHTEAA